MTGLLFVGPRFLQKHKSYGGSCSRYKTNQFIHFPYYMYSTPYCTRQITQLFVYYSQKSSRQRETRFPVDVVQKTFKRKRSDCIGNITKKAQSSSVKLIWMEEEMWKQCMENGKEDNEFLYRSLVKKHNQDAVEHKVSTTDNERRLVSFLSFECLLYYFSCLYSIHLFTLQQFDFFHRKV